MSNSDITGQADSMKSRRALERQSLPQDLREGCLECAADVLSKVLDLSSPVPVPDELVQAAIRVFPVPPAPVKPLSAPALPVVSPRLTYRVEAARLEPVQVEGDAGEPMMDGASQTPDSADAVVMAGTPSKR